jgi:hypothetical protein
VRGLLRLYPGAWRERYGEEFDALLDDVELSPFDVFDIVLGALDARLRPQHTKAGRESPKEALVNRRHYGYAAVIGGALWLVTFGAGMILPMPAREAAFLVYPFAAVALLLALGGLSAAPARRKSGTAWLAFLLPAGGLLISLGGVALLALSPSGALVAGLEGYYVWLFGILAMLVGSTIFAVHAFAIGAFPRGPVASLGVSGAVGALAGIVMLGTPWTPVGPSLPLVIVATVSLMLYGFAWLWLGSLAIRRAPLARAASA